MATTAIELLQRISEPVITKAVEQLNKDFIYNMQPFTLMSDRLAAEIFTACRTALSQVQLLDSERAILANDALREQVLNEIGGQFTFVYKPGVEGELAALPTNDNTKASGLAGLVFNATRFHKVALARVWRESQPFNTVCCMQPRLASGYITGKTVAGVVHKVVAAYLRLDQLEQLLSVLLQQSFNPVTSQLREETGMHRLMRADGPTETWRQTVLSIQHIARAKFIEALNNATRVRHVSNDDDDDDQNQASVMQVSWEEVSEADVENMRQNADKPEVREFNQKLHSFLSQYSDLKKLLDAPVQSHYSETEQRAWDRITRLLNYLQTLSRGLTSGRNS